MRLLLAPYPFEREAALTATAWLISAWFYWNIATAVFKRAGLASVALYRAGLFPLRIGFVFIAAAFPLLAYLFFKTGLEALQEKGGVGKLHHLTPLPSLSLNLMYTKNNYRPINSAMTTSAPIYTTAYGVKTYCETGEVSGLMGRGGTPSSQPTSTRGTPCLQLETILHSL